MTMHFLFLQCYGTDYKILENSISPAMDLKGGPITERGASDQQSSVIPSTLVGVGILPAGFEKRQLVA